MNGNLESVVVTLQDYGLSVLGAFLILVAGWVAARLLRKAVRKGMARAKVDPTVAIFTANIVYWAVLAFTVIAALARFGVQTTSLVAILGAASFAVGMALQGSLSHFAAGVLILLFRPFRVGDVIEGAGVKGTVKAIDLFSTELATFDNVRIVVPNGKLFGDTISNYSSYDTRRVDLVVGISYDADLGKAMQLLRDLTEVEERILSEPEPLVAVDALADSSVNLVMRFWVRSEDYGAVRFDMLRRVKELLDREGIDIPYPQTVVHLARA
ncbi:MAG: mechanosensitive ion channel family protein [Gammaproteobacteria bacterium]|nr:MAG: mechanosensitive ion channel family protein [Gammaproteobacteria bacterium]